MLQRLSFLREGAHLGSEAALKAARRILVKNFGLGGLVSSGREFVQAGRSCCCIAAFDGAEHFFTQRANAALHGLIGRSALDRFADVFFGRADISHKVVCGKGWSV